MDSKVSCVSSTFYSVAEGIFKRRFREHRFKICVPGWRFASDALPGAAIGQAASSNHVTTRRTSKG